MVYKKIIEKNQGRRGCVCVCVSLGFAVEVELKINIIWDDRLQSP